jgi:hypothetical protein
MPEPFSELVALAKLNGDFKRNYGKLIGAYLYLRSIGAARGRSLLWGGFLVAWVSAGLSWAERHSFVPQVFLKILTCANGVGAAAKITGVPM